MSDRQLCPHCHQSWQPKLEWDFSEWRITTQFGSVIFKSILQAKVFDLLYRKQGMRGLTRERIVEIIYMDDLNGGPEDSQRYMSRVIHTIRAQLISVGIWLKRGFTGGEGYSLIFMTPEQAGKMKV